MAGSVLAAEATGYRSIVLEESGRAGLKDATACEAVCGLDFAHGWCKTAPDTLPNGEAGDEVQGR